MILVVFFPLISFLLLALVGRYLGTKGSQIIACGGLLLSFLFSLYIFLKTGLNSTTYIYDLGTWIQSGFLFCKWSFLFDTLTAVMLIVVTSISFLVHFYSLNIWMVILIIVAFFLIFLYLLFLC